jgi:hypothetical protein
MHYLGLFGMPRRVPNFIEPYFNLNFFASLGSNMSVVSTFFFFFGIFLSFYPTFFNFHKKMFNMKFLLNKFFYHDVKLLQSILILAAVPYPIFMVALRNAPGAYGLRVLYEPIVN